MSANATVVNGKIQTSTSSSSVSNSTKTTSNNSLDKDAFLQLLVAQMKYQDPLEPTSNTEYISQFATFSELEEMQNLSATSELQRASSLVGQYVFMEVTSSTGVTSQVEGQVDYVTFENNKAYLSINEELYSLDDLVSIADSSYLLGSRLAASFATALDDLPDVEAVTLSNKEAITKLETVYKNMTDYQKTFLTSDQISLYNEYITKLATLTGTTTPTTTTPTTA